MNVMWLFLMVLWVSLKCVLLQQLPLRKKNSGMILRLISPLMIDACLRLGWCVFHYCFFVSDCLYDKIYLFYLITFSECNASIPVMIHKVMKQKCELNLFFYILIIADTMPSAKCRLLFIIRHSNHWYINKLCHAMCVSMLNLTMNDLY